MKIQAAWDFRLHTPCIIICDILRKWLFFPQGLKMGSKRNSMDWFAVPWFLVSQSKHFKSRDAVHIVHTVHKGTGGGHVDDSDDITATAEHLQYWRKSSIITIEKGNMAVFWFLFPQLLSFPPHSEGKSCRPLIWEEMCSYANTDEEQETILHMCKISSNREGGMRLFTCGPDGKVEAHATIWQGRMEELEMPKSVLTCLTCSDKPTF